MWWLDVYWVVYELGLKINCIMLYGYFEIVYYRVDYLFCLCEFQDEIRGFQIFILLVFYLENIGFLYLKKFLVLDDLCMIVVSCLMLDNILYIKVYWIMLGIGIVQIVLVYGVDDFDGIV